MQFSAITPKKNSSKRRRDFTGKLVGGYIKISEVFNEEEGGDCSIELIVVETE
jgi:hypothetical protein